MIVLVTLNGPIEKIVSALSEMSGCGPASKKPTTMVANTKRTMIKTFGLSTSHSPDRDRVRSPDTVDAILRAGGWHHGERPAVCSAPARGIEKLITDDRTEQPRRNTGKDKPPAGHSGGIVRNSQAMR